MNWTKLDPNDPTTCPPPLVDVFAEVSFGASKMMDVIYWDDDAEDFRMNEENLKDLGAKVLYWAPLPESPSETLRQTPRATNTPYNPRLSKREIGDWRTARNLSGGFEIVAPDNGQTLVCCRIYQTGKTSRAIAWLRDVSRTDGFYRGVGRSVEGDAEAVIDAFKDAGIELRPSGASYFALARDVRDIVAKAFDLNPFVVDLGA